MRLLKKFKILPAMLLLVVISWSCGGDDDGPDPVLPRTAEDVRNDFKELALTIDVGVNDLSLESLLEGYYWHFRIIMPPGADLNNRRPLVLNLHGAAQSGSTEAHKSTDCLVTPAFEGKDVIVLSPNSKGMLWYEEANVVQVLALLDLVTESLPVDPNRIVVTGYSDGGNGSWFFAQFYPNIFSASIPMASSYNTKSSSGNINKIDVPLYVIHGENDELFPLEVTQEYVNESIQAGSDITFEVAPGLSHNEPCNYLDHLKDAVNWLEQEVW